jgi:murein DD-endopeptidase MepM/ murein hydrolase activator NlpD
VFGGIHSAMNRNLVSSALLAITVTSAEQARAQAAQSARYVAFDVPIHIESPVSPAVFRGDDGRRYLAYHLILSNWSPVDLVANRIEVLDASSGRVLMAYDTLLLRRQSILQVTVPDAARRETLRHLAPGRTAVFRAWIPLEEGPAPRRLLHRFTFEPNAAIRIARAQADTDAALTLTAGVVAVDPRPVVVISPPLRDGPWRAGGGPGPTSYHIYAGIIDGRARIAERFAIDYQKVDSAGSILPNPFPATLTNAMFYSNRAEVLAVGDGTIAFVRDGLTENIPTPSGDENMPIPLTRESGAGNQIGLKLAEGVYAQYAHLAPGSIRVKVGQHVRRGEVIANVGNVGNSKNPHLHFEIADGPEINGAQGLPWVFDKFDLWGHQGASGMPDIKAAPVRHRLEMLLQDGVVRFP